MILTNSVLVVIWDVDGFHDDIVHLPAAVEALSAFGLSTVLLIMSFHDLST